MKAAIAGAVGVRTFEELRAWQLCAELRDGVLALCEHPSLGREFTFCDQLRASSRSAPRLIAEGFGRYGHREFRRYLSMARAELLEVQNDLLELRTRPGNLRDEIERLRQLADHAARVTALLRSSISE